MMLAKIMLNRLLSICAPSTNLKAKYKTNAFITKLNKPKVRTVTGNDKKLRIGFTNVSIIVSATAVRTKAIGLSNEIWVMK